MTMLRKNTTRPQRLRHVFLWLLLVTAWNAPAQTPEYHFRNSFWRNLHHLLYAQALSQPEAGKVRRVRLVPEDQARAAGLTEGEAATWSQARDYYVTTVIKRNLLFDDGMVAIGRALSAADPDAELLASEELPEDLRRALNAAAPVYRRHWWNAHQKQNEQWRDEATALLAQHGSVLRQRLVQLLGAPWPAEPVTVDLVHYANPQGAYTSLDPVLVTIATSDVDIQGNAALEILLHETAHGMIDPIRSHLVEAADSSLETADGPRLPRDLWHQVQFYLVGAAVAMEIDGYTPYADAVGLWTLAWSPRNRAAIHSQMRPYLSGDVSLHSAVDALVHDLSSEDADRLKANGGS